MKKSKHPKPIRGWWVERHDGSLVDRMFSTHREATIWITECGDPTYRALQFDLVPVVKKRKAKS